MILEVARSEGAMLVTTDEHLGKIPGVKWIDPGSKHGR